ncbi:tetratricopeptide repeat protein [Aureimonas glaciei]|uniref:Tetratricopeptide repeat protein n=1 Tax=Aureimonas glaciei TaxID=1776957 RepID=A0A916XUE3_9HYPH|nr:tetratricopeptide repeat protein [Aureimonas glaciei]GGD11539.1 hypothetical protein GCM10011335_13150 [Aureimonas glaciei]
MGTAFLDSKTEFLPLGDVASDAASGASARTPGWALACLVALLALLVSGVAAAQTVPNVAPRVPAEQLPEIEAARARLFAEMMRDPANLDIAFRYADLSSRAGDLEAAIATLERMLIFAPGLPRLQLELGVLYYRLGAFETAQTYFDQALAAPSVPEEVRTKVAPYLAAIGEKSAVDSFSGTVTTGVRWQSNANAAPESRLVQTTLLTDPLLLDPSALSDDDVNGFVAGSFHYSRALAGQGDQFEAHLQTYGALYAEHDEINTGYAELTLGPTFNLERLNIDDASFGVYGILGGVTLKEDPYLLSGGIGMSLAKLLTPATRLTLRGEFRGESFEDSDLRPTASERSGSRFRGQIGLQHQVTGQLVLFGTIGGEHRDADRDYLSYSEFGINLGGALDFRSPFPSQADPWTLGLAAGYLDRGYDEPDPVFSLTEEEEDEEFFVESSLTVPLRDDWALQATLGYRDVSSNYDLRRFDNVSTSFGVVKRF